MYDDLDKKTIANMLVCGEKLIKEVRALRDLLNGQQMLAASLAREVCQTASFSDYVIDTVVAVLEYDRALIRVGERSLLRYGPPDEDYYRHHEQDERMLALQKLIADYRRGWK